jgi:hypothetical protein
MNNPYLRVEPHVLAGIWSMRAAQLMPDIDASGAEASIARDTAYMLLAGAMRVAHLDIPYGSGLADEDHQANESVRRRRVRFEVLRRAAFVAIPVQPERWLADAQSSGLTDIQRALESDDGLCEVLRHLQQVACIGGRWHAAASGMA